MGSHHQSEYAGSWRRAANRGAAAARRRSACLFSQRFGRVIAGGTTMANFAQGLSRIHSRIIHDRTGLTGGFDIDLEFTPDPTLYRDGAPGPGAPVDPNAPWFFTASWNNPG